MPVYGGKIATVIEVIQKITNFQSISHQHNPCNSMKKFQATLGQKISKTRKKLKSVLMIIIFNHFFAIQSDLFQKIVNQKK